MVSSAPVLPSCAPPYKTSAAAANAAANPIQIHDGVLLPPGADGGDGCRVDGCRVAPVFDSPDLLPLRFLALSVIITRSVLAMNSWVPNIAF